MSKKITTKGLIKFNKIMALLHALQAVIVLVLSSNTKGVFPVTTDHLVFDKATERLLVAKEHLFDLNLAHVVAAFFIMSALAHLSVATWYRKRYEKDLDLGINRARWIEYSLSASTMMVGIGLLTGIQDFSSLAMMFTLTAGMNLMGLVMEVWNQKQKTVNWLSYKIGCLLGIVPWLVIIFYLWASDNYGAAKPPTFVYFIYVTIFASFNIFAWTMYKQYKRQGKWVDYLYGERTYIILSLVAKSLLAWQVFAGTLRP